MNKINFAISILLIFISSASKSQIIVDYKFDNYCECKIDSFIVGVQNHTNDVYKEYRFLGDTGSILIPEDKLVSCYIYYFRKNISFHTDFPTLPFLTDIEKKSMTLPAYRINFGDTSFWNTKYYYCDNVCCGYLTDFYKNGNKRLEGRFKDGVPRILKYYNINGELIKIERYNRKRNLIKTKKIDINKT